MALPARVRPGAKLTLLARGTLAPVGKSRKSPTSPGFTAVTFTATARASAGMAQVPATGKFRWLLAPRGSVERVSTTRQGVSVWAWVGSGCEDTVAVLSAGFGSWWVAGGM